MRRLLLCLVVAAMAAGCAHAPPSSEVTPPKGCYTESGYLDSTNGCSARAGYPDCYLVCPDQGTRKRL
jgi:hypothetical protein